MTDNILLWLLNRIDAFYLSQFTKKAEIEILISIFCDTVSKRNHFHVCSILIGIELTGSQAESSESSFGQIGLERREVRDGKLDVSSSQSIIVRLELCIFFI